MARRVPNPKAATSSDQGLAEAWFDEHKPKFDRLRAQVHHLLVDVLEPDGIDEEGVRSRVKEKASFLEKAKGYSNPSDEIHDVCGLKVVVSFPSQAKSVVAQLRGLFDIDEANSVDKGADLGEDRVGYNAVHLVATIGKDRALLAEWKTVAGLKFEIQVRTILQDAWAEFEHDRNYKFGGELPPELKRRLKLAAGLLEVADREFDAIAGEVEVHAGEVAEVVTSGSAKKLGEVGLDSIALRAWAETRFAKSIEADVLDASTRISSRIVRELEAMGFTTLKDLDAAMPKDFDERLADTGERTTTMGALRNLMLAVDARRYFKDAWGGPSHTWTRLPQSAYEMAESYGQPIEEVIDEYGVTIDPSF